MVKRFIRWQNNVLRDPYRHFLLLGDTMYHPVEKVPVKPSQEKTYTAKDMEAFAEWCLLNDGSTVVNMDDEEMKDNLKKWEETKRILRYIVVA